MEKQMFCKNILTYIYIVNNYVKSMEIQDSHWDSVDAEDKIITINNDLFCHKIVIQGINYLNALQVVQKYLDDNNIEYNPKIFGGSNENTN